MSVRPPHDLTGILSAARRGDEAAADRLLPMVYEELRSLADRYLERERPDHTLQATALVHEAYLKLVRQDEASFSDRRHFFAVAAVAMRRILVNHAKSKKRLKRGGDRNPVPLDEVAAAFEDSTVDLIALDAALTRLAAIDEQQAKIVELRFFSGLSVGDVSQALGCSVRTVHREWAMARAWLKGEIAKDETGGH